jgi:peptidoglycan hydrolase CwlO-like protein
MDNDKLFDFMSQIYSEMKDGFNKVDKSLNSLEKEVNSLEKKVNKTNIVIVNDIKPDIKALFDGYKQNTEQLTRIENEVNKHDEIILRRVK